MRSKTWLNFLNRNEVLSYLKWRKGAGASRKTWISNQENEKNEVTDRKRWKELEDWKKEKSWEACGITEWEDCSPLFFPFLLLTLIITFTQQSTVHGAFVIQFFLLFSLSCTERKANYRRTGIPLSNHTSQIFPYMINICVLACHTGTSLTSVCNFQTMKIENFN